VTKVLYIEDNDDNVYMLKMRLELLGDFEVLAAEDGQNNSALSQGLYGRTARHSWLRPQ
jgi:CheY-like chemotaxis protein